MPPPLPMARHDGGALAPAPAPAPTAAVYLPAWRRAYDRLVKMLRQASEQAEALSVERESLLMEIQFLESGRREREQISQARIDQICKKEERRLRVVEAETSVRLSGKELQIHCYKKLLELAEDDLEDFKSCISNLAAENNELKEKLKKFESEEVDNSDQRSGKDIREELRKLKKAYKILSSEKEKEISALRAEKDFVWNQLKTMEDDYRGTIKSKNTEVRQATEAAQKLLQNVDELQVEAQKKDDEIVRLQIEVTDGKERISLLEDELQKLRCLETDKDAEASRIPRKDSNKAKRRAKSTRTSEVTPGTPEVTPDRREVKITRARASESNPKRKRSSFKSAMSCGNQICYTRPLQIKAALSPMLLPPNFTVPRLKAPTPP